MLFAMVLMAWLTALLVAAPVSQFLVAYFGSAIVEYPFDYATSRQGIWLSVLVVTVLGLIATWVPVRMAVRQDVGTAVNYD